MKFYRVYKARVIQIIEAEDNKPEIVIAPEDFPGEDPIRKYANPPSIIPTSGVGSGMTSIPDVGQLCLVAETDSEYKVNILSYLQPDGVSSHGVLSGEYNSIGGFVFKVGALNKSVFAMDRSGRITMYSDSFSRFEVDGSTKKISRKSRSFVAEYAGGFIRDDFSATDPVSGIDDLTTHHSVYTKNLENPGFSDSVAFDIEQPASPPPISRYIDKVVLKQGSIMNIHSPDQRYNHVYQLETRQSTGSNRIDKDTVTALRLGYQERNQRYSTGSDYPEGAIIEWTAKRNTSSDNFIYWNRVGKIKEDLPQRGVRGEFYSLRMLSDKVNGRPHGIPTEDPVGEGSGWSTAFENSSYLHQYSLSLGPVESGDYTGSMKREYLHDTNLKYWSVFGGENMQYRRLQQDEVLYNYILNSIGEVVSWEDGSARIDVRNTAEKHETVYTAGDSVSKHELSRDGALVEHKDTKVYITDKKIILKTGDMQLELSEERGLVLNGTPLVYSTLVEFLTQHQTNLGFAMGSPVPMSPTALSAYNSSLPRGFKQNVGFKTGA
jgi:hypothetical protein